MENEVEDESKPWNRRRRYGTVQWNFGERSRLGCCSVRPAPNIGGVESAKRWLIRV